MNPYDPQKAARVWQRVQETQEPARGDNWPGLLQESLTAWGAYRQLARQYPSFQRLAREERKTAAALRGICLTAAGSAPPLEPLPAPRERPEVTLRKCYARAANRAQEYGRRSREGEYAPVFCCLEARVWEQCLLIMEALGTGGKL